MEHWQKLLHPIVIGKPNNYLPLTLDESSTCMVGDNVATDVCFANAANIDSILIDCTYKISNFIHQPTMTFNSIKSLLEDICK